MEVTNSWSNNDINKYYIITRDKETNEWKFFRDIVGHTVFWKDKPSYYGMTKSRAIEVLNIVKNLTNEDIKPEPIEPENPTEPTTEPETPTNPTEGNEPTTPTDGEQTEPTTPTNTDPTDTPTEPSEGNNDTPTNTDGEISTGENNNGETSSEGDTEPITEPENNTEPTDPATPVEEPTEPQYKIITISSVTYNSTEVAIFDDDDYNKLKSTLIYIDTTYPNTEVHVVTVETDNTGKSIFYFYLEDELTWLLELRTNIDYSLVNHVTTLDDIRELL